MTNCVFTHPANTNAVLGEEGPWTAWTLPAAPYCSQVTPVALGHSRPCPWAPALCRAAPQLPIHCTHSENHRITATAGFCYGKDETAHLVLQGRAPAWLSPQLLGESAPHTAAVERSCTFCPAQPHFPAQIHPWGAQPAQHRKHFTTHPVTMSDFLTATRKTRAGTCSHCFCSSLILHRFQTLWRKINRRREYLL